MPAITSLDLSNAKLDVDHIADIATSLQPTATDRLGNTKDTMVGAVNSIKAFNNRGAWQTSTSYAVKDLVIVSGTWYVAVVAHTSSATFATDTATYWRVYQGVTSGDLAAQGGAGLVGNGAETVAQSFNALQLTDYTALRSYAGSRQSVYVTGFLAAAKPLGISGMFVRDNSDTTTVDDAGLTVVASNGIRWKRAGVTQLLPEWWGADPTNTKDSLDAWNKCILAAKGKEIKMSGVYKMSDSLIINYADANSLKIVGTGAHLLTAGSLAFNKCAFNFDGIAINKPGLEITAVRGLVLEDFFVSHRTGGGNGVSVHIKELDRFRVTGVCLDTNNGSGSAGFRFGNTGAADCAFMGTVQVCKVLAAGGASFDVRPAATSINFINCYQIGGFYSIDNSVYCSYTNCASEAAPLYGYIATRSTGIVYDTCAGEANKRGVFYVEQGCANITFISPFGAANNTLGNVGTGDLIEINGTLGFNAGIIITNPVSLNPNAATTSNINSTGSNSKVSVDSVYAGTLAKGIAGTESFKLTELSVTGEGEVRTFSPTLGSWNNVLVPTITARYLKKGKSVQFWISVSAPAGGSISTTNYTSTIQLPWTLPMAYGASANFIVSNGTNTANCPVDASGVVHMPSVPASGFSFNISGTIYIA